MARSELKTGAKVFVIRTNVPDWESMLPMIFWHEGEIVRKASGRAMVEVAGCKLWLNDEALVLAA